MKYNIIPENIGDYFYYDESSPSNLRWLVDRGRKIKKDSIAGYLHNNGFSIYWRVNLNDSVYPVHRIVWFLHHRLFDSNSIIDHVDNNTENNRICNLRLATGSQNMYNMRISRYNKSGVKGVCYQKSAHGNEYWRANLKYTNPLGDKKKILKLFPFNEDGFKEAAIWIQTQRELYHGAYKRDG